MRDLEHLLRGGGNRKWGNLFWNVIASAEAGRAGSRSRLERGVERFCSDAGSFRLRALDQRRRDRQSARQFELYGRRHSRQLWCTADAQLHQRRRRKLECPAIWIGDHIYEFQFHKPGNGRKKLGDDLGPGRSLDHWIEQQLCRGKRELRSTTRVRRGSERQHLPQLGRSFGSISGLVERRRSWSQDCRFGELCTDHGTGSR